MGTHTQVDSHTTHTGNLASPHDHGMNNKRTYLALLITKHVNNSKTYVVWDNKFSPTQPK